MLVAMILVGGLTRLTDSGLSITEWKPITGALPPLSTADWQSEFHKYQQIPEFLLQNSAMSLAEFQAIYWWEWGHRLLGRLIGLVVAIPLVIFWVLGFFDRPLKIRLVILFLLGGLQGFLGWWMVSSGLGGLGALLDVSPYRLVIHLGMALVILAISQWTWLDVARTSRRQGWQAERQMGRYSVGLLGLLYLQILLGGFVAANDGGLVGNTWPLIEGGLLPQSYGDLSPFWRNGFEDPMIAQFQHRIGAYLVLIFGLAFGWASLRQKTPELRRFGVWIVGLIGLQVVLGIWTLLAVSPIHLAIAHQFLALLTFMAMVNAAHACSKVQRTS